MTSAFGTFPTCRSGLSERAQRGRNQSIRTRTRARFCLQSSSRCGLQLWGIAVRVSADRDFSAVARSVFNRCKGKSMTAGFTVLGYLLAAAARVSFVFQQAVNANLRADIGSVWWTGFVSYLSGTLVTLAVAIAMRDPLPSWSAVQRSHWISWSGGLFGAIYIAISIVLLPRLGAAVVIALIVAGQMIGSLVFDHFGLLGVPVHEVDPLRLIGAALIIAGVVLIRFWTPDVTLGPSWCGSWWITRSCCLCLRGQPVPRRAVGPDLVHPCWLHR
jgi:transporter family-2 protein